MRYSTDRKGRKYVRGYGFLSFTRGLAQSAAAKRARDALLKHGTEAATKAAKRAVNKAAEATGDLVGQKIADKIVKKAVVQQPPTPKEFTPEEKQRIINELALL